MREKRCQAQQTGERFKSNIGLVGMAALQIIFGKNPRGQLLLLSALPSFPSPSPLLHFGIILCVQKERGIIIAGHLGTVQSAKKKAFLERGHA